MFHYKMCGLPNVWLANGYKIKETPYGQAVSVVDADGLHKLLATQLIKKNGHLTGKEFRFLRTLLRLSQKSLADMLQVSEQSVSLWERRGKAPAASEAVLRMLIAGKFEGDCQMAAVIDRINTVDRLVNQRTVARARLHKWSAKEVLEEAVAA
jgi:DNA-binding transcriptional regulator YiaG